MVQTRLIRPGNRTLETPCPVCRHLRKIHTNARRGIAHCIYCRAVFEWQESDTVDGSMPIVDRTGWTTEWANTPV